MSEQRAHDINIPIDHSTLETANQAACTKDEIQTDLPIQTEMQTDESQTVTVCEKLTEKQKQRKALMPFAIISISYLLYTITDGSIRMVVLLHAYNKAFTAMEVSE